MARPSLGTTYHLLVNRATSATPVRTTCHVDNHVHVHNDEQDGALTTEETAKADPGAPRGESFAAQEPVDADGS
jgi:hypothetical protein